MNKKDKQFIDIEECLQNCETMDEFAETCGHLINKDKEQRTAQELWDEYCSQYNDR